MCTTKLQSIFVDIVRQYDRSDRKRLVNELIGHFSYLRMRTARNDEMEVSRDSDDSIAQIARVIHLDAGVYYSDKNDDC